MPTCLHCPQRVYTRRVLALNSRNPEADRLASEVAALSGQTETAAVIQALRERLRRLEQGRESHPPTVLYMGRDHGGLHTAVSQQLLDRADVQASLQHPHTPPTQIRVGRMLSDVSLHVPAAFALASLGFADADCHAVLAGLGQGIRQGLAADRQGGYQ